MLFSQEMLVHTGIICMKGRMRPLGGCNSDGSVVIDY